MEQNYGKAFEYCGVWWTYSYDTALKNNEIEKGEEKHG